MLEISLSVEGVSVTVPAGTHTAVIGPPACGASTLLRIIAGDVRPQSGEVRIGTRVVTELPRRRRPLLYAMPDAEAPGRWSVQHLLVAAARTRSLDREDRLHEIKLAAAKWHLDALLTRRLDSLSSTERAYANLARIELLRPGVLVADRLLEHVSASVLPQVADELYRTLRVLGTTVVVAPAWPVEVGLVDALVVLDRGRGRTCCCRSSCFRSASRSSALRMRFHCVSLSTARMSTSIISSRSNCRPRAMFRRWAMARTCSRSSCGRSSAARRAIDCFSTSPRKSIRSFAELRKTFSSRFCCSSERFSIWITSGRRHHLPGGRFTCASAAVAASISSAASAILLVIAFCLCPAGPTTPTAPRRGSPSAHRSATRRRSNRMA